MYSLTHLQAKNHYFVYIADNSDVDYSDVDSMSLRVEETGDRPDGGACTTDDVFRIVNTTK